MTRHVVIFDSKKAMIHCENCDYFTGDDPKATPAGCLSLNYGIEHCNGCHKKEVKVEYNKRVGRQRLAMDIPEGIHKELKMTALKHNCTVTKFVLRIILEKLKKEKLYE